MDTPIYTINGRVHLYYWRRVILAAPPIANRSEWACRDKHCILIGDLFPTCLPRGVQYCVVPVMYSQLFFILSAIIQNNDSDHLKNVEYRIYFHTLDASVTCSQHAVCSAAREVTSLGRSFSRLVYATPSVLWWTFYLRTYKTSTAVLWRRGAVYSMPCCAMMLYWYVFFLDFFFNGIEVKVSKHF